MVWFIDPQADTIEPKLHFAYTPSDQDSDPDGPDNITVSPYGGVRDPGAIPEAAVTLTPQR